MIIPVHIESDDRYYPRVLVISGYTFCSKGGGSITLSNLFRGWPIDRLAIIDADANTHDDNICRKRFNLTSRRLPDGQSGNISGSKIKLLATLKNKFARFLGIAGGVRPITISDQLLEFIANFQPDIIYTQASQLSYMNLVRTIKKWTDAKVIYHFMDDFPTTTYTTGLLSFFVRKQMLREVAELIKDSSVRMGISDAMCDAYQNRYGVPFVTFHNPLDLNSWLQFAKCNYTVEGEFRVVYTGRIGTAASASMNTVCAAIRQLRNEGMNVIFQVFTQLPLSAKNMEMFTRFGDAVSIHDAPLEVSGMAKILGDADILVMPIDFDQESIKFIRYSMPTKIPAYMISGTPILVFGPHEVFSVQYAKNDKWGYVVEQNDARQLVVAIRRLCEDVQLREHLGKLAQRLAKQRYDSVVVREQFRSVIASCVEGRLKDNIAAIC
jgi:glycosyltransferase involved in cell wall biosynthesis